MKSFIFCSCVTFFPSPKLFPHLLIQTFWKPSLETYPTYLISLISIKLLTLLLFSVQNSFFCVTATSIFAFSCSISHVSTFTYTKQYHLTSNIIVIHLNVLNHHSAVSYNPYSSLQVQQIAQAAQQLQQLQKVQHNNNQHNTSIPPNAGMPHQTTQTTPPNNNHNIPASILTPSTPGSGGLTPQHLKTPSRILEPSPEETTDLEELEQFAKTFKQRRIKLGR